MMLAGIPAAERAQRVQQALDDYGLSDRAEHRPDQLSGGQRQRVAIARATIMQPALILADEPTGNLDRATGEEVVRLLEELNARGVTLIMVTHDAALGARARRRIAMEDGSVRHDTAAVALMRPVDILRYAYGAAAGNRLRTLLLMLAMAIGVAAVVVLTALGDGARRYVVNEFSAIGSNLVIVLPGRSQTGGFSPANAVTSTPRDLTVADARALQRAPAVRRLAPVTAGTSELSVAGRLRETLIIGTTTEFLEVRRFKLAQGRFLPDEDWDRGGPVMVIGAKLASELFGTASPLGQFARIGDRRFRVIGVLAAGGSGLGMTTDELAIVPVAQAQAMFNSNTLFRILVEARNREVDRTRQAAGHRPDQAAP